MSSARRDSDHDSDLLIARAADLLIREAEFGVVVASRTSEPPITLAGSARAVWTVFETPCRVGDAVDEVARRIGVEAGAIRADVEETINRLITLDVLKRGS